MYGCMEGYQVLLLPVTMKFSEGFYTRSQIANRAYATMGNVKMLLMATPVTVMRITTVPIATTSSTTVPPYLAWMEIVTITRATVSMGTKGPIVRNISIVAPIQVVMAMGSARKSWDHLNVNVMVCCQSAIVFSKQHCSVVALRNLVEILTLWASLLFESIVIDLLIWLSSGKYFRQFLPLPYNMYVLITWLPLLWILYLIYTYTHTQAHKYRNLIVEKWNQPEKVLVQTCESISQPSRNISVQIYFLNGNTEHYMKSVKS